MFSPRTVVRASVFVCVLLGIRCAWAQPEVFNLGVAGFYLGAPFDPGVDDLGLHCDDCTAPVAFPFPVRFYGVDYTSAVVSSNGNVQFEGDSTQFTNLPLPTRTMQTAVFVLWDDLLLTDPGDGVFTSTTGVAPSRVFNIEWRAHYYNGAGTANFEVRFFEGSRNLEVIYGAYDHYPGQTYETGVQWQRGELFRSMPHDTTPYPPGTRVVFSETYTGSSAALFTGPYPGGFPTGVTDIGNHCDDCVTNIALPFPVRFYGQEYTDANVSSNGNLQFASANADYNNTCLPVAGFGPTIFAHWDDLRTDLPGKGIFTRVTGAAPQRILDIEWRAGYFSGGGSLDFTLRFYEGLDFFERYYITCDQHGAGATLGSQAGDERYQAGWCNTLNAVSAGGSFTDSLPPMEVRSRGGTVFAGTTDIGNHCDDCTTDIALPFTVSLFGEEYTTATVSSNGTLQFQSANTAYSNQCLPAPGFGTTVFAYWDDLRTDTQGAGVFTVQFFGEAPDRVMGIEWRATSFATGAPAHFGVVLYELTPRVQLDFGDLPQGGGSATVGVQHGAGTRVLQYSCNTTGRLPVSVNFLCLPPACEVTVLQQPSPASVCGEVDAEFSVLADGTGALGYQWEWEAVPGEGWVTLVEGVNTDAAGRELDVTGATSLPLVVHAHGTGGSMRCVVSTACGTTTTSDGARLIINSADFDGDGDLGTDADIEAFFACLGGDCCGTCGSADFNGDGDIGTDADIESFFRVLGGGGC